MPWQECTIMSARLEFVRLAEQELIPMRTLCQRFGISPKTGYKWRQRYAESGPAGLVDQPRRPRQSPRRTPAEVEAAVLAIRAAHPRWGGRKIQARLRALGPANVPSASTITAILARHGHLADPDPDQPRRWQHFEHSQPNDLWQLDFMGHRPLDQGRVHPLALLDDHSRYALTLAACPNEQQPTVLAQLTVAFQRYGLPRWILTDNGPPWGTSGAGGLTTLEVQLLRLGIGVRHGRAYHPQTQGKVERFHQTVQAEALGSQPLHDLAHCQQLFDAWRTCYNQERPHHALDYQVPASRYQPSPRPYPTVLPSLEYGPDDAVRMVKRHGVICYHNRRFFVGRGLAGQPVAVRPTAEDGVVAVYYCHQQVATLDLRAEEA